MRLFLSLFLGCLVSAFAKAQLPQTPINVEISLKADHFYGVDDFNNIYYSTNNVFYKTPNADNTATQPQQFYDVQLGELTTVDLINPLKILLFYRDTQTIVLLDNRLNESLRINLASLKPYRYFEFATLAGERRFWLYNMDLQRLELFDYLNDKLIWSSPVIKDKVRTMLSDYNYCHLITDKGIASYNNYGSRTAYLNLPNISLADYDFEELLVLQNNNYKGYKFTSDYRFEEVDLKWKIDGQEPPKSLYLKNGKLYLYRHDRVSVHTTNQNKN
jgi:hypothetical protein